MNCCEQNAPNGGCNQGRDCPVRTSRLAPNLTEADPLPIWYAGDEPVLPLHREGKFRILAISTERRSPQAADLPTLVEAGYPDVVMVTHFGLSGPAGMPADILARLAQALRASLADASIQERLAGQGVDIASPDLASPEGYARLLRADLERSRRAVQLAGLKPE